MNATLNARIQRAGFDLIRMSTRNLIDDTRVRPLRPPVLISVATATIAECLAAKAVA